MRFLPLLTAFLLSTCSAPGQMTSDVPRNVVFFISDGCGLATFTMGRGYAEEVENREPVFDRILTGTVQTRSSHERVSDSAASATAYACGIRTRNGRIATDPDGRPVGTVLEAAERAGYWTGLVSTARITHATPAAFSAHVVDRAREDEIASQQLEQGIEVILGGGLDHFLPAGSGGNRSDGRNLLEEASAAGYTVVLDADGLEAPAGVPVLGLFDPSHVDYEIDRDEGNEPSLAAMTRRALDLLKDAPQGFFLMVEAGRIDHAGHANDAAAHLRDLLAYDEAMRVALDFADRTDSTLVVATSDHETGGLGVGRDGVYDWNPEALRPVNRSIEVYRERIEQDVAASADTAIVLERVLALAHESGMGPFDDDAVDRLRTAVQRGLRSRSPATAVSSRVGEVLADIVSRRAGLAWTTTGHTAIDVPMYAYGPGAELFSGSLRNDEFGRRLARVLGVDLDPVTRSLGSRSAD